ncbi:ANTAR domain-containing protein [Streptomyces oceani]|uniref:ANTAR domain-containing protein n=1 Tax=Streptomyces oceani TaxID=1075402 RepID=A0A1E7JYF1_9ACTN|nr:GAF and ANTAR domain-containing protein [Streptomyces oceani]OEU96626.1 hypothetical protein AN216_19390 [Streptomyces oceani]
MPSSSETELAALLASRAQTLQNQTSVARTLQEVVDLAATTVEGADFAGVTFLGQDGRFDSRAYTATLVMQLDEAQYKLGEGPCQQEMADGDSLRYISDMSAELRWPRFTERARTLGVGSMLVCHLPSPSGTISSLNLYSVKSLAFDASAQNVAAIYAAHATVALSNATVVDNLAKAMDSRQIIGEATGILMERYRVTSPQAFDMLVHASQTMNVKLRVVARQVTKTGISPGAMRAHEFDDPIGG